MNQGCSLRSPSTQTIIVARRYDDYSGVDVPDEDWSFTKQRVDATLRESAAQVLFIGEGGYRSPETSQTTPAWIVAAEFGHDQVDLAMDVLYRHLNASQLEYLIRPGR